MSALYCSVYPLWVLAKTGQGSWPRLDRDSNSDREVVGELVGALNPVNHKGKTNIVDGIFDVNETGWGIFFKNPFKKF